jgi:hypothetical protein
MLPKGHIGFRQGTERRIKKDLFDMVQREGKKYESLATKNVKTAFRLFKKSPVDTGATRKGTRAIAFWGASKLVIRFRTANDMPSNDGKQRGFAVFPLLGLSTSKKYGERNWLVKGAEKTLKDITK